MGNNQCVLQGEPSFTNFTEMRLADNNGFYQLFYRTLGETIITLPLQIRYSPTGEVDVSHIKDVL